MKKVVIFLLTVALALGGLGFAHAAVTASQDDLVVYPTLELGDSAALAGRTASLTFTCGDYLRWHTDYPFGGEAVTEFSYGPQDPAPVSEVYHNRMEVWFSTGISSGISGGSFHLSTTGYGKLLRAVADETPNGQSRTMELRMADYLDCYQPEFELFYEDALRRCSQSVQTHNLVTGEYGYGELEGYRAFLDTFRFPIQEDHIATVTVGRDDTGGVCDIEFQAGPGPELYLVCDVSAEGIWFVPVFQDEDGTPLPYESPEGHGLYHVPWKDTGDEYHYMGRQVSKITPDFANARLMFPLEESRRIAHIHFDQEAQECWMLICSEGRYTLTIFDLSGGTVLAELSVLPYDPAKGAFDGYFVLDNGYLLVTAQGNLALVDMAQRKTVLTAPDVSDQLFAARYYDSSSGDLFFDGQQLVLTDTTHHRGGAFWAAAYRQGEQVFYGEYNCSILRANEDWYYSYVTAEDYPVILK